MADWSKPTITSNYIVFVDEAKARDVDAITLQLNALTSPPTGSIRLLRSPVKFQEWDGTQFVDKVLSPAGGGTGVANLGLLGPAMGLGTMAIQNATTVAITGGTISNVTLGGNITHNAGTFRINGAGPQEPLIVQAPADKYAIYVAGSGIAGRSFGVIVRAGTNASDLAFTVENAVISQGSFYIWGNMVAQFVYRLVIPVGVDLWAPA
jgi:hypothetical protein